MKKTIIFLMLSIVLCIIMCNSSKISYSDNGETNLQRSEIINFLTKADQIKYEIKYKLDSSRIIGYKDGTGIAALVGKYSTVKDVIDLFKNYFSKEATVIELQKIGLYIINDQVGRIMAEGSQVFLIDKESKFEFLIDESSKKLIKINMCNDFGERKDFYYTLKYNDGNWLITDEASSDNIRTFNNSWITIKTSSELFSGGKLYKGVYIWDKDSKTSWVPAGKNKDGIGEWIDIAIQPGQDLKQIRIINGYAKSEQIYQANNRVKRIKISFDDGTSFEFALKDGQMGFQTIQLPKPKKVERLRITILEIYPGTKYRDTCISEIEIQ